MWISPRSGSNTLRFHITTTRSADGSGTLDGPMLPTGQWSHVAVTFNGDVATLYLNGAPVDTQIIDTVAPLFSQVYCYLGRSMWNADPMFNGRIDDFRIYNYAVSGSDIWTLWGGSAAAPPQFQKDPIELPNAVQDVSYTGQTLASKTAPGGSGTLTFSKLYGPDWLKVAANGTLIGTPANSDVGLNYFVVRVRDGNGATDDAELTIEVQNVNDAPFWKSDPVLKSGVTQGKPLNDTLVDDADDIDLEVDPNEALTFCQLDGPQWLTILPDGRLGGLPSAGNIGANAFTVRVSDAYGQYADAELIIPVYNHFMRSYYPFDGDLTDRVSGFHGVASGNPDYVGGKYGQAIRLDGVEDFVTLPAGAADYEAFTIAVWVYWYGGNVWQRIFDFGNNTDQYMFLTPRSGDNTLRFAIKNQGGEQRVETSPLPANQAAHIAVTLSGNTARLYVNGALKASNNNITLTPADFQPSLNYIGKSLWAADPLFHGLIDEFRIYDYAMPSEEIVALFENRITMNTLRNIVQWWLSSNCPLFHSCGSADRNKDGVVDWLDFADLTSSNAH
ncbi:MAG TPA: hypothetical protein ENN97_10805 [Phycisphaerales bacterium]|nr:hypothetical protein [Phycisphaerales bacterium]